MGIGEYIFHQLGDINNINCVESWEKNWWDGQGVWGPWRLYEMYSVPRAPCTVSFPRLILWNSCKTCMSFRRAQGHLFQLHAVFCLGRILFLSRPCQLWHRIVLWQAGLNTRPLSIYACTFPLVKLPRRGYVLK